MFIKDIAKVTLYQPLYNLLIFLAWLVPGHNVGVAIILLTILVRIALYPLNASMIRSQRALAALQPEIDKIKAEFKNDQQAQSKAMLELYQAKKINPFGSCVLLLVQLPILWILYHVFTVGLDTSRFDLLYSFMPRPETLGTMFLGANLTNPNIFIGLLAGIAQFIQTRQLTGNQPKPSNSDDPSAKTQAIIQQQSLYLFPVLTVIISAQFPSALGLYWLTTTLAMIAQQWWMTRNATPTKDAVTVSVRKPTKKNR